MSIIHSNDESQEIVQAKMIVEGWEALPDTAIVCFRKELIDYVKTREDFTLYSTLLEMRRGNSSLSNYL